MSFLGAESGDEKTCSPASSRATSTTPAVPEPLSFAALVFHTPSMCPTITTRSVPGVRPITFRDVSPLGRGNVWRVVS